ncbi:unnamed protein product [Rhizophagus irregularis]|nr:unnamed protein product [Rhizophagus irregularis]
MSTSATSAIQTLRTLINNLGFTEEEKEALRKYFIGYEKRQNDALTFLPDYTTNEAKLVFFRSLISTPEQPVAGNKRRRISDDENDYDNECLVKVWNSFKRATLAGRFLIIPKEVSYLLGTDDTGNELSTLFIRTCYIHFINIIFASGKLRRWLVIGNPGIGKTFLGYFLLYLFAKYDKTVIYHRHGSLPILFSKERVTRGSSDEFISYLSKENCWYIVDADKPGEYNAKTILICSPQVQYYKKFRDLGVKIMYMPVWSLAEIENCRINIDIFKHLKKEEIMDLYNKWGGIPRYVLFHAQNYALQRLLDSGINEVNPVIMNYVGEISHGNEVSHRLVHIHTNVPGEDEPEEGNSPNNGEEKENPLNIEEGESSTSTILSMFSRSTASALTSTLAEPNIKEESSTSTALEPILQDDNGVPYYGEFILQFASDYVAEGVINRLVEINKQALLEFVKSSVDINEYSTLRGVIFERLAHRKLIKGGNLKYRALYNDDKGIYEAPKMERLLFSNINEIKVNKYCIPTQQNNKSFDAFISPNEFFQMTIAKKHPIIKSGLEQYIEKSNKDIDYYFVVPSSIFSDYKEQPLHSTKRTVLRNKPAWLHRFQQYVIDIELTTKDI